MWAQGFRLHHISRVDLFAEVGGELALLEGEEVDGSEDDHDDPADTSVDSEDDFRPVGLYEHPAKDGTTEAAKTMVNTLKNSLG